MSDLSLNATVFPSVNEAAEFAMENWTKNYVLLGLDFTENSLEMIKKRPVFVVFQVNTSFLVRHKISNGNRSIEDLATMDDAQLMNPNYLRMLGYSKIIFNNDGTLDDLKAALKKLEFNNKQWIRPAWDSYFMTLADLASQRSNCMKRRVGAVIVQDNKVVSTGYNGTPRNLPNCSEGGCPRCNSNVKCGKNLEECICMHAEENAMLEVGAMRANGATLYSTSTPCLGCTKRAIQVGIKRVVFGIDYSIDHNSKDLFEAAGVKLEKLGHELVQYYSSSALAKII